MTNGFCLGGREDRSGGGTVYVGFGEEGKGKMDVVVSKFVFRKLLFDFGESNGKEEASCSFCVCSFSEAQNEVGDEAADEISTNCVC